MIDWTRSHPALLAWGRTAALGLAATWSSPVLAGDPWKDALKRDIESVYTLSKRATLSPDRITKQGTVVVVRKDGITADLSSDMRYSVTKVTDGQVGEGVEVLAEVVILVHRQDGGDQDASVGPQEDPQEQSNHGWAHAALLGMPIWEP